ncbi:Uncharacterised protein [Mycobacteroides abscessus subsp. abscessus]|nr:Uncharacterised protein [Mycobacteroides abscessus subsp. abscessus]
MVIAVISVIAEQQAMIKIDFKGMLIFLNPYVKPTLKLSRLTANASIRSESVCTMDHAPSSCKSLG